ncbi:ankyrin repeat-containing protein [Lodderomyces elongisporus]|uniref:ankyrin repeat-containing protein n=1 Tax=Lodderomyces elongisporus TaxID=36914 RepID=UPI00291F5FDE|nr:ankyrin repeat-containing protein [Lodderomyces elongisporus]WLF81389.1 ankyrin repeat-containing protein [Lodderomyces elongisporus]
MSGNVESLTQEEMDVVIYDARVGDLETLQEIFAEVSPSLLLSIKDDITLATPIHMAAANGHLETVRYLLSIIPKEDAVKLVASKNETGNTALHWAAFNGHLEVVQLLIEEYNADAFDKNTAGHDAIYEAENNGKVEVENWFLKKYTPEQEISVEEEGDTTKVVYTPGKESKLADDNAREAAFKASLDEEKSLKSDSNDKKADSNMEKEDLSNEQSLEQGIKDVSIESK